MDSQRVERSRVVELQNKPLEHHSSTVSNAESLYHAQREYHRPSEPLKPYSTEMCVEGAFSEVRVQG